MTIYRIEGELAKPVEPTTFQQQGILERRDIQRILQRSIEIVAPQTMVLADEFGEWSDGHRRIDLLCLHKRGNLVVVEIKRTEDGGHMELQAIRYAAMASSMTFQEAIQAHRDYLSKTGSSADPERAILDFLEWDDAASGPFNDAVSIVLASAEFSKEITTTVMWLNSFDISITCVRLRPYILDGQVLLNVEQIIPLPEAAEFQVRVRQKERQEREARTRERDTTRFDLTIGADTFKNLPKRKLVLHVAREAIRNGANPREVLPDARRWIIVNGILSADEFQTAAVNSRAEGSSLSETSRFFTEDGELFHFDGKTFALTKMWGIPTLENVNRIIAKYKLTGVEYKAVEEG